MRSKSDSSVPLELFCPLTSIQCVGADDGEAVGAGVGDMEGIVGDGVGNALMFEISAVHQVVYKLQF